MTLNIVQDFEKAQLRGEIPTFRPGDTVRVAVRIVEGDKERVQDFEGLVISRKGSGLSETFTVRRTSMGIGMERIFPLHSPRIESIQVMRCGRVRRAKLYFLRELRGKAARIADLRDRPGRGTPLGVVAATAKAGSKKKKATPIEGAAPAKPAKSGTKAAKKGK